jgi:hypothetical protein
MDCMCDVTSLRSPVLPTGDKKGCLLAVHKIKPLPMHSVEFEHTIGEGITVSVVVDT